MKCAFFYIGAFTNYAFVLVFSATTLFAQNELPQNQFLQAVKEYDKLENPEISFEKWVEMLTNVYNAKLEASTQRIACPQVIDPTGCTSGDFNDGIFDNSVWQGEYGLVDGFGILIPSTFLCGIIGGPIDDGNSHHTMVPNGSDPNVGTLLSTTPDGMGYSLRIGNAVDGNGSEFVSKTFQVTPANSNFSFDYAVVLENPNSILTPHTNNELPTFRIEIVNEDAAGAIVNGLVDLDGSGNNFVLSNNSVFFADFHSDGIVYSDWLCCNINLSSLIGNTITISFIVEDCGNIGHYGYAYIDNICAGCSNAPYTLLTASNSSDCNLPANICFDYQVPASQTLTINLQAVISGSVLQNWTSSTLTDNGNYCFTITSIAGLGSSGIINFNGAGIFSDAPTQFAGIANYEIPCPDEPPIDCTKCCAGKNLIRNWSFEKELILIGDIFQSTANGFSSDYNYNSSPTSGTSLSPGDFLNVTSAEANTLNTNWKVNDSDCCEAALMDCCNKEDEHFLIIDGNTLQAPPSISTVYKSTNLFTSSSEREKKGVYKFCLELKHLPQPIRDIVPSGQIIVHDFAGSEVSMINYTLNTYSSSCEWDQFETFFEGIPPFTVSITLDESGKGKGNDMAIDNVSIVEVTQTDEDLTLFNVSTSFNPDGTYSIKANPVIEKRDECGYFWEVCEWSTSSQKCMPDTKLTIVDAGWHNWGYNTSFEGYHGTSSLGAVSELGIFELSKTYRIKFGTWCECSSWNETRLTIGFNAQQNRVLIKDNNGKIVYRSSIRNN